MKGEGQETLRSHYLLELLPILLSTESARIRNIEGKLRSAKVKSNPSAADGGIRASGCSSGCMHEKR